MRSRHSDRQPILLCDHILNGEVHVAAAEGQATRAVTLWSAAVTVDASIASWEYREHIDAARGWLDAREVASAEAAGRTMTLEQAVAYVLQEAEAGEPIVQ